MDRSGASPKHASSIDENLRRVYEPPLEEPVPDRLRLLLEELKRLDRRSEDG